ncbi:phosphoglucosamine mutase [bacterium]|nr:phosphoglucosamine mutase [bacterium]
MSRTPLMISVAGIRGIVGDSMTAAVALRWAEAFGSLCKPGAVVIGGDSRVSKTMMRAASIAGVAGAGAHVIDVGVVSTPTIQLAVEHYKAAGGIAITASHNPAEWNALKFFNKDGLFLDEAEGLALRKLVESDEALAVDAFHVGKYERDDEAVARHIERVLKIPFLNLPEIKKYKFRAGIDAVNGAGGELAVQLLEALGCEVVGFNLEPTGLFPRSPEPLPENLVEVCQAMKRESVDVGFVVDPDADRLAVIRSDGKPAGEELTLAAAAQITLKYQKGAIVANCSSTRALDDIAVAFDVPIYRTKVGEAHVSRKIIEAGAVIGGEGNGGVMLPSVHAARDSAVGMALILQALAEHGGRSADYFDSLPKYFMVKKRREFSDLKTLRTVLDSIEAVAPFGAADRLDGLKWTRKDSWVQVRASNTEPIIRIFAEARTEAEANSLVEDILRLIDQQVK